MKAEEYWALETAKLLNGPFKDSSLYLERIALIFGSQFWEWKTMDIFLEILCGDRFSIGRHFHCQIVAAPAEFHVIA
jgi:hypothetical protein